MAMEGVRLGARAITKWVNSRTVVGALFNSPYKHQCVAWMAGTRKWLRTRLHTDTPSQIPEEVFALASPMATRLTATNRSSAGLLRRSHKFSCAIPVWKPVLSYQWKWLRCTFWYGFELAPFILNTVRWLLIWLTACISQHAHAVGTCAWVWSIFYSYVTIEATIDSHYWVISYHVSKFSETTFLAYSLEGNVT